MAQQAATPPSKPSPKSNGRILALDIIRGYFILVIASIHLGYWPSLIGLFSGRGQMWVSEADGFFLISGLITGIIRHRNIDTRGFGFAWGKVWQRAWLLYATGVILGIAYLIIGRLTLHHGIGGAKGGLNDWDPTLHVIGQIVTLQYTYGWADFLVYYAVFLFITPLALWLMQRKAWWAVLASSLGLWVWQWAGGPGDPIHAFMVWQTPFFMGLVIGYYWNGLQSWFNKLRRPVKTSLQVGAMIAAVGVYVISYLTIILPWSLQGVSIGSGVARIIGFFDKIGKDQVLNNLLMYQRSGLLRPLVLVVALAGLYCLVRRFEDTILRVAGWLLVPAGQNSLYVYIVEGAILFVIPYFWTQGSFVQNTLLELGTIGLVYAALRTRFLFNIIPH